MSERDPEQIAAGLTDRERNGLLKVCAGVCCETEGEYCDKVYQDLERKGLCHLSVWSGGWKAYPEPLGLSVRAILESRDAE